MQAGLMKGRRPRFVSWSGRSPGEGNGNPLQYSCLENPMDRGAWQAMVHGIARVGHDLATKPQPPELINQQGNFCQEAVVQWSEWLLLAVLCLCVHGTTWGSARSLPSAGVFSLFTRKRARGRGWERLLFFPYLGTDVCQQKACL